jgi:hypothetical protein
MNIPATSLLSILILTGVAYILWLRDARPLVKKYTGGKSHGWWWQSAIFQDYFLARKIIREKELNIPIGIKLMKSIFILNLMLLALFITTLK